MNPLAKALRYLKDKYIIIRRKDYIIFSNKHPFKICTGDSHSKSVRKMEYSPDGGKTYLPYPPEKK